MNGLETQIFLSLLPIFHEDHINRDFRELRIAKKELNIYQLSSSPSHLRTESEVHSNLTDVMLQQIDEPLVEAVVKRL